MEMRLRLSWRYWMKQLSQFLVFALIKCRNFPPTILSGKLLLRRDGRHSFDFLKNLSLHDVSPLVFV
jgi:hypothetical protein